jgi:hypothetical protein
VTTPTFEYVEQLMRYAVEAEWIYWLNTVLLSWQWWLLIFLLIVPWIIWWRFVDKKRLTEILLVAFVVFIASLTLDEMGTEMGLWDYRYRTTPFWHVFIPYNFAVLPVTYSLIYQRFQTWKSYLITFTFLSGIFSFVAAPVLEWMNIYELFGWRHVYSFPIYILMALFARYIVEKIILTQKKALNH